MHADESVNGILMRRVKVVLGEDGVDGGDLAASNSMPCNGPGESCYSFISTAAVQAANIKASPGRVFGIECFNTTSIPAYVRLYNETTTPGTGDAASNVWRGVIPSNSVAPTIVTFPNGISFGAGIGIRVSAGQADDDATDLTPGHAVGNVRYQ